MINYSSADRVPRPLSAVADACRTATLAKAYDSAIANAQRVLLLVPLANVLRGAALVRALSDNDIACITAADDAAAGDNNARRLLARFVADVVLSRRRMLLRAAGEHPSAIDVMITLRSDLMTPDDLRDVCVVGLHAEFAAGNSNNVFDESQAWLSERFRAIQKLDKTRTWADRRTLLKTMMAVVPATLAAAVAADAGQLIADTGNCVATVRRLPTDCTADVGLAQIVVDARARRQSAVVVVGQRSLGAAVVGRANALMSLSYSRTGAGSSAFVPSSVSADDRLAAFAVARGEVARSAVKSRRRNARSFVAMMSVAQHDTLATNLAALQPSTGADNVVPQPRLVETSLSMVRAATPMQLPNALARFRQSVGAAGAAEVSMRRSVRVRLRALRSAVPPPPPTPQPSNATGNEPNAPHNTSMRPRPVRLFGVDELLDDLHDADIDAFVNLLDASNDTPLVAVMHAFRRGGFLQTFSARIHAHLTRAGVGSRRRRVACPSSICARRARKRCHCSAAL